MIRYKNDSFVINGSKYLIDLNENLEIEKLALEFYGNDTQEFFVSISYVQNSVIEDPVFAEKSLANTKEPFLFEPENSFMATHIIVELQSKDVSLLNVDIEEKMEIDMSDYYPKTFDTYFNENKYIDEIIVYTELGGYCNYSVYTSINDRDFNLVAKKTDDSLSKETGDIYSLNHIEARVIRVFMEYNSSSPKSGYVGIKYKCEKSHNPIVERPSINVVPFSCSKYNVSLSNNDTVDELYGIVERTVGAKYRSWFNFEVKNEETDYFEIKSENGKVLILGNNGVCIASGLNYYYKYFCNVCISQMANQTAMPENIVLPSSVIRKETPAKIRYAYNYCTHSYTMAFWGEEEWQKELDYLALNGVNAVLDITAQEEVWRRFLTSIGYNHNAIKQFIAGPAYYAWCYMGNMFGFGGPIHDSWFERRTELARKNHLFMRKLGMSPVLQGYSGIVPNDINEFDADAQVIPQGRWGAFSRPNMLKTTWQGFSKYAEKFYTAQREVYGDVSNYYATDPFHEGGVTGDLMHREISSTVLSNMLRNDENAVWVIQSWQGNPTSELLSGLSDVENGQEHALILDLYSEKTPHYNNGCKGNPNHGYSKEFDNTPWCYCMLNNFGGRMGLHGHLDNIEKNLPKAFNESKKIAGIGITPEATENNPVLYDYFFEIIWQDDAKTLKEVNLNDWIKHYINRRYGAFPESVFKAWRILLNTVYKAEYNMIKQGAPECIFCARPSMSVEAASSWGNSIIGYDNSLLLKSAKMLLSDYELLKDSETYAYDLVTVFQQLLSNDIRDAYIDLIQSIKENDYVTYIKNKNNFLYLGELSEKLTSSNRFYLLGNYLKRAESSSISTDDFSAKNYLINAKAIITTWGNYNQSEIGGLHDYSNRQWSGLINDFYRARWENWFDKIEKQFVGGKTNPTNYFYMEWKWVVDDKRYSAKVSNTDLVSICNKIINNRL